MASYFNLQSKKMHNIIIPPFPPFSSAPVCPGLAEPGFVDDVQPDGAGLSKPVFGDIFQDFSGKCSLGRSLDDEKASSSDRHPGGGSCLLSKPTY